MLVKAVLAPIVLLSEWSEGSSGERTEQVGHIGQKERIDTAGRKVDHLTWDFHTARSPVPRYTDKNFFCYCAHMWNITATTKWLTHCVSSSENNIPIIS